MIQKSDDEKLLEGILLKIHGVNQRLSGMLISKFTDDYDEILEGPLPTVDHTPWRIESDITEGERRFCFLRGGKILNKHSMFHI